MHIAVVTETYPPEVNGVALTLRRMLSMLCERGHRIELVRPRQPHEEPRDTADELRTAGLPLPMYRDVRMGLATKRALINRWQLHRPDLVHVATEGPSLGLAAVNAARELGIPVTSDFRTRFDQYSRYYGFGWMQRLIERYLRSFHNRCALSFVPTPDLRDELSQRGFERLHVVGRGVDTQQFSPRFRSIALRSAWGVAEHDPVLLYVGRLASEKNVDLVLRAFGAVQSRCSRARLVLVGDGPARRRLYKACPAAISAGTLHGDALATHYASADIFLFPSLTDTFGNVVLEAMASGLGVIAFRQGAPAVHIENLHSGILVPPGNEARFIASACVLASDMRGRDLGRLNAMRMHARSAALDASWARVVDGFEGLLMAAARGHAPADTPAIGSVADLRAQDQMRMDV